MNKVRTIMCLSIKDKRRRRKKEKKKNEERDLFIRRALNRCMQSHKNSMLQTSFQFARAEHVCKHVLRLWFYSPETLGLSHPVQDEILVNTPNWFCPTLDTVVHFVETVLRCRQVPVAFSLSKIHRYIWHNGVCFYA